MGEYWSSSDFAYLCLLDQQRTLALRDVIRAVVRPSDRVLDVGTGTGILSLFAAQAGAAAVTSVEADTRLAEWTRDTVAANGFADRITVIGGGVLEQELPQVDVVIAELVETALIEETLVPVLNALRERGVIGDHTRIIPCGYRTSMQLVDVDERMYGLQIRTMRHEWPYYARSDEWAPAPVTDRSAPVEVWQSALDKGPVEELVATEVRFAAAGGTVNGVRIMGAAELTRGNWLGACNTLNGDKVFPLSPRGVSGDVTLAVRYRMGAGLRELDIGWA